MIVILPVLDDKCYTPLHDKIMLFHTLSLMQKHRSDISSVIFVCNKDIDNFQKLVEDYYESDLYLKNKCHFVYAQSETLLDALYVGLSNVTYIDSILLLSGSQLFLNDAVIYSTKTSYRGVYNDLKLDIYLFKDCNTLKNIVMPESIEELVELYNKVDTLQELDTVDYVPLDTEKEIADAITYLIENDENNIFNIDIIEDKNYIEKTLKETTQDNMDILYLEKEFYLNTEYEFCPNYVIDYKIGFKPQQVLMLELKRVFGVPMSTLLYTKYDCTGLGYKIYEILNKLHNKETKETVPSEEREKFIHDKFLEVKFAIQADTTISSEERERLKALNELYYEKYKDDLLRCVIYNIDNHVFDNMHLKNILYDIVNDDMHIINPRTRLNQIGFILDDYVDLFNDFNNIDTEASKLVKNEIIEKMNFNKEMIETGCTLKNIVTNMQKRQKVKCECNCCK